VGCIFDCLQMSLSRYRVLDLLLWRKGSDFRSESASLALSECQPSSQIQHPQLLVSNHGTTLLPALTLAWGVLQRFPQTCWLGDIVGDIEKED
jgi:hypothetical protein